MARVYLVDGDSELVPMESSDFENEDIIQLFIAKCPDLLAGEEVTPSDPRRWLLVAREVGIPIEEGGYDNFSLDHLLLDQDGVPTFIEVKRASDTRARREVVAQMLDYAANATSYMTVESLRTQMARFHGVAEDEVDDLVAGFIDDPDGVEAYWQAVKTNLRASRIRLVFAADSISPGLRRIIEFLNAHTDPIEVLALEIKQFQNSDGRRTLVPRLLGQTSESVDRKSVTRSSRQWDEASFFDELAKNHGASAAAFSRLVLEWAHERKLPVKYGLGSQVGSLSVYVESDGRRCPIVVLYTSGHVETQFQYLSRTAEFADPDKRLELAKRFNTLDATDIPVDPPTLEKRRPSLMMDEVSRGENPKRLIDVLEWIVKQFAS